MAKNELTPAACFLITDPDLWRLVRTYLFILINHQTYEAWLRTCQNTYGVSEDDIAVAVFHIKAAILSDRQPQFWQPQLLS